MLVPELLDDAEALPDADELPDNVPDDVVERESVEVDVVVAASRQKGIQILYSWVSDIRS